MITYDASIGLHGKLNPELLLKSSIKTLAPELFFFFNFSTPVYKM